MFGHFMQGAMPPEERGIYLAGDDVSFMPGWVEGAVQTALNAVWGVMAQMGGTTARENPGPGDVWETLGPVRLDE